MSSDSISSLLLAWYDRNRRRFPWRAPPGRKPDPYRVWLSEIMLQQTTTAAVVPYYERFLARFPSLADLAAAEREEVLKLWAGLGYYARARNLHRCAETVMADHGGTFPRDVAGLKALPGIGDYTAAAVAAIAFDVKAAPLDGNWERVLARLFLVETPLPAAKKELRPLAESILPDGRAGDFAQAMMDLGATLCSPEKPSCLLCPLKAHCIAHARGMAESLPRKMPKAERPERHGVAFFLTRPDGAVLLRQRPDKGLLGGMTEVPSTPWRATPWSDREARVHAPAKTEWSILPGQVTHVFTHFRLTLHVWRGQTADLRYDAAVGQWHRPEEVDGAALPSVMRKVVRKAGGA